MTAVHAALAQELPRLLGGEVQIERLALVPGGASMETWSLDARSARGPLALIVRRSAGGRIYSAALSLEQESRVLQVAFEAGVRVPRVYGHLPDLAGRDAFVMERLEGETIGRRIVQRPELQRARDALPEQMAEQLARIHAIAPERLPFLPGDRSPLPGLEAQLDSVGEPHPAIELGLAHLRARLPRMREQVVCHGDFRVGNFVVGEAGLVGVLDWEFAHAGDPREDLAWPFVRAWRFGADGLRLGGIGQPDAFLRRYRELSGRSIALDELRPFELLGNVRWAIGSLTQSRRHLDGKERSVELAVLGRLAAEVEQEILRLVEEDSR